MLDAQPGSRIYAGLKKGCDEAKLRAAIEAGNIEHWLHSFEPRAGDCVFIPTGTVHALGAGLLVAEIQQASDTTYRLYDWGRLSPDGKPRQLHVEEALAVIDYSAAEVAPQRPAVTDCAECLVACDKFVLHRRTFSSPTPIATEDSFHLLTVLDGEVTMGAPSSTLRLPRGQTALLPVCLASVNLHPQGRATLLDIHLPRSQ